VGLISAQRLAVASAVGVRGRPLMAAYGRLRNYHVLQARQEPWRREGIIMHTRIAYGQVAQEGVAALGKLETYVRHSGLEHSLLELVKTRASQLNGCGYCLDMHTKDARAGGETEQRLYVLSAWREAPFYTERERAALEWTEALTLISQNDVSDDLYGRAREQFSEKELVDLTLAITAINSWNRLSIGFRSEVGSYEPKNR